jgi:hypothetical protein
VPRLVISPLLDTRRFTPLLTPALAAKKPTILIYFNYRKPSYISRECLAPKCSIDLKNIEEVKNEVDKFKFKLEKEEV